MRKASVEFLAVTLVLAVVGALLRQLELMTVVDEGGLAAFKPVTAGLLALSVLAAVYHILFARRSAEWSCSAPYTTAFRPTSWLPVALSVLCLAAYLYGAWQLFGEWKRSGQPVELAIACMSGLCGASWLYLRLEERHRGNHLKTQLLSGFLITLFFCFWLVMYYRDYAPVPSLILTVYGFLALCAATVAGYSFAGGSAGRLRVRRCLTLCGIGAYLCVVAMVGESSGAYRLFFGATAAELLLTGMLLLSSVPVPAPKAAEEPEADGLSLADILRAGLPLDDILGDDLLSDEPLPEAELPQEETAPEKSGTDVPAPETGEEN